MKQIVSVLILMSLFGLSGCATTGGQTSSSLPTSYQQHVAALKQSIQKRGGSVSQLFFLEIPSTPSAISNFLLEGMIKADSSTNAMDALLTLLQKAPGAQVVVFGGNDAVTAASVGGVLKNLNTSPDHAKTTLWVALKDPSHHVEILQTAAQTKGMRLEVLQSP
jgi:uncharacterized protein YceK